MNKRWTTGRAALAGVLFLWLAAGAAGRLHAQGNTFALGLYEGFSFLSGEVVSAKEGGADVFLSTSMERRPGKLSVALYLEAARIKHFGTSRPSAAGLSEADIETWSDHADVAAPGHFYVIKGLRDGRCYLLWTNSLQGKGLGGAKTVLSVSWLALDIPR